MTIKEFSQENSTTLFYTTIALIVAVIILGVVAFAERGQNRNFSQRNLQNGERQEMMRGKGFQRLDDTNRPCLQAPATTTVKTEEVKQ
jgi:hypothetical protein